MISTATAKAVAALVALLLLAVIGWAIWDSVRDCSARGGAMARTFTGYKCVREVQP